MIRLGCILARMTDTKLPDWLVNDPGELARIFSAASHDDIDLVIKDDLAQPRLASNAPVQAYDLHQATLKLARNPESSPRAENIVVLFAGSYDRTRGVFGVMFDRGFTTKDDPSESERFCARPREGCAIFLDTIKAYRPEGDHFEQETKFTTVHEMGHVFNRQHLDRPVSYMARSPERMPLQGVTGFTPDDQAALANCSRLRSVWPGGDDFGGRNTGDNLLSVRQGKASKQFGLELAIDIGKREFWPFEPVELDIELRVAKGVTRAFRVEDVIDPGYDEFTIWIEDPAGERRRYRSPRRYCSNPGTITVKPGAPFQRDVSIFGQAGGFSFSQPGVHTVWAVLDRGAKGQLRSAKMEVNVLPPARTTVYREALGTLGACSRAKLLYHRVIRHGLDPATLLGFCETHANWSGIANVEYGLGRSLLKPSTVARGNVGKKRIREGLELLRRARDRTYLGQRQRSWAEALVADGGMAALAAPQS